MERFLRIAFILSAIFVEGVSPALGAACPKGAIYQSQSTGAEIVVKRIGIGESSFLSNGTRQPAIALDILAADGQRGAAFGPMRSSMFVISPDYLESEGYNWEVAEEDEGGFYRILSDDGNAELFTMTYVRCAK